MILANASAPLVGIGQAIRGAFAPELLEGVSEPPSGAAEPIPFQGRWTGTATSHAGEQPIILEFRGPQEVLVQFAGQPTTPLVQPAFESGTFSGRFAGSSDIPEAARTEHTLALKLVLVDGDLTGQLVAQGLSDDAAFMLPSFVRLIPEVGGR